MLALRIALRYLLAPKSHNAVNVITLISIGGVAVATAAIVIVLSVFNGFNDLAAAHLSAIDPELKVTPVEGKAFRGADSLARALPAAVPGVAVATPVIEERALLVGASGQMPVVFKGVVPEEYARVVDVNSTIIDGLPVGADFADALPDSTFASTALTLSVGVAMETGLRPGPDAGAEIFIPRRMGRINPANPAAAYRREKFTVTGVFRVEQPEYDTDRVIIPLSAARRLLEYNFAEASALELRLSPGASPEALAPRVEKALGPAFRVATRLQQQEAAFRMIAIEKWMTFVMLIAILLIATFNIISTLSLLVIEKRDDTATLRALGAPRRLTARIFRLEGVLVTLAGGAAGLVLGSLLSLGQQHFGWIKLAGDPRLLSTSAYPMRLEPWPDLAVVAATVAAIAIITGLASALFIKEKD